MIENTEMSRFRGESGREVERSGAGREGGDREMFKTRGIEGQMKGTKLRPGRQERHRGKKRNRWERAG